jgi:hypothetical protein
MAQAGPNISRRFALVAAIGLPAAVVAAPLSTAALDDKFMAWERELDRIEAIPSKGLDDDALDALIDQAGELSSLIYDTPGASLTVAKVKLRHLVRDARTFNPRWAPALQDVLSAISPGG